MPVYVDPELIERAGDGDGAAFEQIVRLTHGEVYGLAYRLLADPEDARDVTQDTYLRVFRSLKKFRGDSSFSTWLYRITANCAYTALRKRRRHLTEDIDSVEEPESTLARPEEAADTAHLRSRLVGHLEALPAEQRAVVVLKDVYDLPHEAIAAELGISVTAAKVRLHRARRRLRAAIEMEGPIDAVS